MDRVFLASSITCCVELSFLACVCKIVVLSCSVLMRSAATPIDRREQ